ncbi:MAG: thioredoxin family protein [Verrucomicrobiota bacterium]|jgi:thioredoxin-related protein|nr:thioredoxin family protein [Verrucomicrobiota bacterium]
MKANGMMKRTLVAGFVLAAGLSASAFEWRTHVSNALVEAKAKDRPLLLFFTGSDWCGWCQLLNKEVFDTEAFEDYANSSLVSVMLDFPQKTRLPAEQVEQNERLAKRYEVRGFPTIHLFSPDGEWIGQLGYQPGGPEAFIKSINQEQARFRLRRKVNEQMPRLE